MLVRRLNVGQRKKLNLRWRVKMKQFRIQKILLLLGCLILPFSLIHADDYLLTEATYRALEQAQAKMAEQQYAQAERDLLALIDNTASGSYDRAVVLQTLGFLYAEREDYQRAMERFEQALALNALPDDITNNLRFNVAQFLIADGQYQAGIDRLYQWLDNEQQPDNSVYVLLAIAHYQINQFTKSVENIRIAISRSNAPREDWYRLQMSAHLEMQQYNAAINVVETLITRFAYNKTYWDQLAALYSRQDKPMNSLAVQMLAKRLDTTDSATILRLTNLYRYLNIPFKAAKLLEQGMDDGVVAVNFDNLEILADSWLAAREQEQAAEVLETMRAMDDSGETDLKLSRVYVAQEKWPQAEQALQQSREKLAGDKRGEAYLLSGMVQFNLDNYAEAEQFFEQAMQFSGQRNMAFQWLSHVQRIIQTNAEQAAQAEQDA